MEYLVSKQCNREESFEMFKNKDLKVHVKKITNNLSSRQKERNQSMPNTSPICRGTSMQRVVVCIEIVLLRHIFTIWILGERYYSNTPSVLDKKMYAGQKKGLK